MYLKQFAVETVIQLNRLVERHLHDLSVIEADHNALLVVDQGIDGGNTHPRGIDAVVCRRTSPPAEYGPESKRAHRIRDDLVAPLLKFSARRRFISFGDNDNPAPFLALVTFFQKSFQFLMLFLGFRNQNHFGPAQAMPLFNASRPASRPMTSTMKILPCETAVSLILSTAHTTEFNAVS